MNNDLIERYLYAATKRLPKKSREDVSRELRGLIEDMLTERCGSRPPEEKDIRIVLIELGSPRELYAKYDEDSKSALISQPYYSTYKYVLKIVLICMLAGMTIACGLQQLLDPQAWYMAVGSWLFNLWEGAVSAFAFLTLLFVFFERKGVRIDKPFDFDDLPPVPKKTQEISLFEPIAGIVFCIVFLVVFLGMPEVLGFVLDDSGSRIPVFHVEAIRDSWYIIILFGICGISGEAVKLVERRYNKKVLAVTVVTNLLSAGLAFWWLMDGQIFSDAYTQRMDSLFAGSDIVWKIMGNFQYFFLFVLLLALTLDTIEAAVKTLRK